MQDMTGEPNETEFIWLLNTELKVECLFNFSVSWHVITKFDKL